MFSVNMQGVFYFLCVEQNWNFSLLNTKQISKIAPTLLSGAGIDVQPVTTFTPLFLYSLHPENIAAHNWKQISSKFDSNCSTHPDKIRVFSQ